MLFFKMHAFTFRLFVLALDFFSPIYDFQASEFRLGIEKNNGGFFVYIKNGKLSITAYDLIFSSDQLISFTPMSQFETRYVYCIGFERGGSCFYLELAG